MRRIQLTFSIENFAKEGRFKARGYIDANKPIEIAQQFVNELRKIYAPKLSFEDFCQQVKDFDEQRFGRTDVDVFDKEPYKS